MKWIAISGSWKNINKTVEKDVEKAVLKIVKNGQGIVTGGAPGVDFIATKVVLEEGNPKKQLRIYLPIKLTAIVKHLGKRTKEGVIEKDKAKKVVEQLLVIHKIAPKVILDKTPYKKANIESYYSRNTKIVKKCDELWAFQVNESAGTQDAIDKAKKAGKKVKVKKYCMN